MNPHFRALVLASGVLMILGAGFACRGRGGPLAFACHQDNDLYSALAAAGEVYPRFDNPAEAIAGTGYELNVIAAGVIGGTSLFGGEGSVVGTVIGALLISTLTYGLTQMNVQSYTQQIIIGAILVLAVWFDRITKARSR